MIIGFHKKMPIDLFWHNAYNCQSGCIYIFWPRRKKPCIWGLRIKEEVFGIRLLGSVISILDTSNISIF